MTTHSDNKLAQDLNSGALSLALAEIAEDAARVILPFWRNGATVETKADDSPVTRADREAEQLIRDVVAKRYPAHAVLGTEAQADVGAQPTAADQQDEQNEDDLAGLETQHCSSFPGGAGG